MSFLKKPVNRFLQDGASAGIRSLQTSSVAKLRQTPWNGLLRQISCHGRNYSQPYFFKRNQLSDNRSHSLLKKLSASDFSYEKKSALRFPIWKPEKTRDQRLATTVYRAFEIRNCFRISLIECDLVRCRRMQQVM